MKKDCMQFKCLNSSFDLNFAFINGTILYQSYKTKFFPAYPIGHYHWHNQDIKQLSLNTHA